MALLGAAVSTVRFLWITVAHGFKIMLTEKEVNLPHLILVPLKAGFIKVKVKLQKYLFSFTHIKILK